MVTSHTVTARPLVTTKGTMTDPTSASPHTPLLLLVRRHVVAGQLAREPPGVAAEDYAAVSDVGDYDRLGQNDYRGRGRTSRQL